MNQISPPAFTSCLMMFAMTLPLPELDSPMMARCAVRGIEATCFGLETSAPSSYRCVEQHSFFKHHYRSPFSFVKVTSYLAGRKSLRGMIRTLVGWNFIPNRGATASAHLLIPSSLV